MKTLLIAACFVTSLAYAQNAPLPPSIPQPLAHRARITAAQSQNETVDTLPENYLLKLTVSEKDQQPSELSMVLASAQFKANTSEPLMSFTCMIAIQDDETILVRYSLGMQVAIVTANANTEDRSCGFEGSVRLRVGEPIQILKSGNRTYQLVISRLPENAKKGK